MPSKVVLILDDDPITTSILKNFLEENGFEVLVTEKEDKCYQYLNSRYIDLVLLDIHRDDLEGLMMTKKIKTLSKRRHTPIISITDLQIISKPLSNSWECDDFITKPIDKKALLEKIDYLMDKYFY